MPVQRGFHFEQTIPYDAPGVTGRLARTHLGIVRVRPHINTSPHPLYDLDSPSQRWSLYSAVVRDGLPSEQAAILNRVLACPLGRPEPALRCRAMWETRFRVDRRQSGSPTAPSPHQ